MKNKWFLWTIGGLFLAGALLSMLVIESSDVAEVDVVAINEIVKTVEQEWASIEEQQFNSIAQQPITILDDRGIVLYQSDDHLPSSLTSAYKNRDLVIDINREDEMAGKLIVHFEEKELLQQIKQQLTFTIIIVFSLLALLCIGYIIFLRQTVFKPFKKLQSFAAFVARGNLDIPLTVEKNNPFGAFTESFDIMREELAAARQREYDANRSKKELVASLSHDIKTPVASIKAVSELMLLGTQDEKQKRQLQSIYAKAEQIDLLVTDMFHATLEELQQLKVVVTEVSSSVLNDLIKNMYEDYQIKLAPIPDCIVLTDVIRLQQVLDNVLSNAYKYAGTDVDIVSYVSQSYLELHIRDRGEGISESELPLLFNKFYRGNNAESQNGSGLGLYISKYFMQNMEGDIACYNDENGFTVALKIKLA